MTTEPKSRERRDWEDQMPNRFRDLNELINEAQGNLLCDASSGISCRYNVRLRSIIQSIRQLRDDLADL